MPKPHCTALQAFRIPLSQDQYAKVDAADFWWLIRWKWYAQWIPDTRSFRAVRMVKKTMIYMARVIMGNPPGRFVDHRDHDTLDNRRQNLRPATRAQNQANHRLNIRNKSGFKGVSRAQGGKWQASIRVNGKSIALGAAYRTPAEAAVAYRDAAVRYFGEFANW